jgi:tRNA-specific 2-thiouridylase
MRKSIKKTVFVGMSGGVDSSVAAMLLHRQGYNVVGVFMRCFNVDGCAERDAEDARRVAEHIGIPFYTMDFEEEYKRRVVDYMVQGYAAGLTPNPDVMCNREIKFGLFFQKAMALGADYVATGHYVKLGDQKKGVKVLNAARDRNKDQSYFLWTLTQKHLAHCLFPVGEYTKTRVRAIAKRASLPTATKKDSQGICFLGQVRLEDFLKQYIPERRGVVLSVAGERIGEHAGAQFYTIGQRHGVGNLKHERGNKIHEPLYVAKKDIRGNTLTVVAGREHPALYRKEIEIVQTNWVSGVPPALPRNVFARVRYRQPLSAALLKEIKPNRYKLEFKRPQNFVAPGQSAVWYSGKGEMLGGGVIT